MCDKWEHIFTWAVYSLSKQKGIWLPKVDSSKATQQPRTSILRGQEDQDEDVELESEKVPGGQVPEKGQPRRKVSSDMHAIFLQYLPIPQI